MKKTYKQLACAAVLLLLAGGCSKNTIYIDGDSGSSGGSGSGSGTSLVTFQASVESRNMTRSMAPVRKNVQATVYTFAGTEADALGAPIAQGSYLSPTPGLFQGLNGFRMYIPTGTYNFYAVSDNTQFTAPSFSGGKSGELLNGVDYLWWRGLQQDVTSTQAGVPIVFMHCATQVIFEVEAGAGVAINRVELAHIYPPVEEAVMDLTTGVIAPADSYQVIESKMAVSGTIVQYTMLPVKTDLPLRVSFDVTINGEATSRTYDVGIPLPDGELKAGDSYRFLAVIRGNEISFPSVDVTNWVDVDETGKPLYPSEM